MARSLSRVMKKVRAELSSVFRDLPHPAPVGLDIRRVDFRAFRDDGHHSPPGVSLRVPLSEARLGRPVVGGDIDGYRRWSVGARPLDRDRNAELFFKIHHDFNSRQTHTVFCSGQITPCASIPDALSAPDGVGDAQAVVGKAEQAAHAGKAADVAQFLDMLFADGPAAEFADRSCIVLTVNAFHGGPTLG